MDTDLIRGQHTGRVRRLTVDDPRIAEENARNGQSKVKIRKKYARNTPKIMAQAMSKLRTCWMFLESSCSGRFHSDFQRSVISSPFSSTTPSGTVIAEIGSVENTWS